MREEKKACTLFPLQHYHGNSLAFSLYNQVELLKL